WSFGSGKLRSVIETEPAVPPPPPPPPPPPQENARDRIPSNRAVRNTVRTMEVSLPQIGRNGAVSPATVILLVPHSNRRRIKILPRATLMCQGARRDQCSPSACVTAS